MSTSYDDGRLKDSTPDSFCEAIVLNKLTGEKIRFRSLLTAEVWARNNNQFAAYRTTDDEGANEN